VAVWEADAPTGEVTVSAPGGARVSSDGRAADAPAGAVLRVTADGSGYHVRQVPAARGSVVRAGLLAEPTPTPTQGGLPDPLPSAAQTSSPASPAAASSRPTPRPSRAAAPRPAAASPSPTSAGFSFDSSSPVTLRPAGAPLTVTTTGRTYRGRLVALSRQGFRLVNALDVEEYLRGLGEVPAGWPLAALRTQAVAARTYALRAVGSAPLGYDVCDDTRCQVYLGVGGESARTTQAARDTRGEVVTYGGRLADTFYSANAGGVTATPGEGFGGTSTSPYLPGGTRAAGGVDPWRLSLAPRDVAGRLGYGGRLDAITVSGKGPSGRATQVRLDGSAGARTLTGIDFQRRLGLRSTLFTVTRGTGAAQALPPADAAAGQLAPAQAATAPVPPVPSVAPSPLPAPSTAPRATAAAAGGDAAPPWLVGVAVAALVLSAGASLVVHGRR
jgi:SpoIID/LytB domain protein